MWILYFIYLFYPFNKFNPVGRAYVYDVLKQIFFHPCIHVSFLLNFFTDQLCSMVIPLKDLEYTICYYISFFFYPEWEKDYCLSKKRFTSGFFMAALPLLYRMSQCAHNMIEKKVFIGPDFFNFMKYFSSFVVAVTSFVSTRDSSLKYLWVISAIVSSCYCFTWDVKMDWGFFAPDSKNLFLRSTLAFSRKYLYYIIIVQDLALRFAWSCTISPDIVKQFMRPEFFFFALGFMEMYRRCVWNFLRVEKEHVINIGIFRAVEDTPLPFRNLNYELEEKKIIQREIKDIAMNIENDIELLERSSFKSSEHASRTTDILLHSNISLAFFIFFLPSSRRHLPQ